MVLLERNMNMRNMTAVDLCDETRGQRTEDRGHRTEDREKGEKGEREKGR
jgi:hypothetical protein